MIKKARLDNLYVAKLVELWVSMLKYENLPDTCDARYIELQELVKGAVVYFKDEVMGDLCLNVLPRGPFTVYGIPRARRAFSFYNNYQKELDETNSVIIWNNLIRRPSLDVLIKYGIQISQLDQIIDINANAQKTPILVLANEKQRLSLMSLYQKWEGNYPVIFGDTELGNRPLTSITTEAPLIADKLYALKTLLWNEALTYIGISNINIQKRERLITDEVTRNLGGVIASRYSRLAARQEGFDKVNKMFGTNIKVEFREDFDMLVDTQIPETKGATGNEMSGGGVNE